MRDSWRMGERRLPGLLYADDLVLCGDPKENLKAMVGRFVEECRRRELKVNAGRSKVLPTEGRGGIGV